MAVTIVAKSIDLILFCPFSTAPNTVATMSVSSFDDVVNASVAKLLFTACLMLVRTLFMQTEAWHTTTSMYIPYAFGIALQYLHSKNFGVRATFFITGAKVAVGLCCWQTDKQNKCSAMQVLTLKIN